MIEWQQNFFGLVIPALFFYICFRLFRQIRQNPQDAARTLARVALMPWQKDFWDDLSKGDPEKLNAVFRLHQVLLVLGMLVFGCGFIYTISLMIARYS